VRPVLLEDTGGREFAQFMADHVFGDKHGVEDFAVVHQERVPNEIRRNGRTARPGLDRLFRTRVVQLLDLLDQMKVGEWSFFE